ncbi:MAG: hypothetical protein U1E45_05680 [Geminicoccaceae bacterium]
MQHETPLIFSDLVWVADPAPYATVQTWQRRGVLPQPGEDGRYVAPDLVMTALFARLARVSPDLATAKRRAEALVPETAKLCAAALAGGAMPECAIAAFGLRPDGSEPAVLAVSVEATNGALVGAFEGGSDLLLVRLERTITRVVEALRFAAARERRRGRGTLPLDLQPTTPAQARHARD